MGFVIDSNTPYFTEFPLNSAREAVYMTAEDHVLRNVFAVVYRANPGVPKLSVILIGAHGTSGYVDITLDKTSRYYGACRGLAPSHFKSPVRRALAIAVLRTYATMDKPLLRRLEGSSDESAAGALGSRFKLVYGKFPGAIGSRMLEAGLISPKKIDFSIVDIVYEDSDTTIDQNNEMVYLLGEQLEQLFDPLSEYSPEPTECVYSAEGATGDLETEPKPVQDLCEKLYLIQAHARGDILNFLQTILIPLRVEVLKGSFPGLTIARLNTVFPPTIDELFRVNNIFYEALRTALPFGAFEVVKACGTTVPYFFRACMRHEAATQKFAHLVRELLADVPEIKQYLKTEVEKIEAVVKNHSQLSTVKSTLDTLVHTKQWKSKDEKAHIDEFYTVAQGTVDAFLPNGNNHHEESGKGKALAPSANILGTIVQDWPVELEYGSLNRRVVAIFDAVDILEPNESTRQLHMVFIIFTDVLVVCQPSKPIPATSLSGLHIPSVGDMLMHAMLNDAAVEGKLPPLKVVVWSPVLDVHFAIYDKSKNLYISSPSLVGSYRLLQPDSNASNLVALLAKAKITTKTRPFHLFRINGPDCTLYSTVQEMQGYREESNKTAISVFLSTPVSERMLCKYGLVAAVSLQPKPYGSVDVTIISRLGYNADFEVEKPQLRDLLVNELSYLMTLSLSSQNSDVLDSIIAANKTVTNRMISWASQRDSKPNYGHKHRIYGTKSIASATDAATHVIEPLEDTSMLPVNKSLRNIKGELPPKPVTGAATASATSGDLDGSPVKVPNRAEISFDEELEVDSSINLTDSMSSQYSSSEVAEQRDVDNWYHQLYHSQRDDDSLSSHLSSQLSDGINESQSHRSLQNSSSIQIGGFLGHSASNLYNRNAGKAFPRIESSTISEAQVSHRRSDTESSFETMASLQNSSINSTDDDSWISGNTTVSDDEQQFADEDFTYLASLVNAISLSSEISELESAGTYPSLRESSLVRLGSYIMSSDKSQQSLSQRSLSQRSLPQCSLSQHSLSQPSLSQHSLSQQSSRRDLNHKVSQVSLRRIEEEEYESTPTLKSGKFVAVPEEKAEYTVIVNTSESKPEEANQQYKEDEIPLVFTPFVDIESADWLPTPVYKRSLEPFSPQHRFVFEVEDSSFKEDDTYELAEDWLAWVTSSSRPTSMLSIKSVFGMKSPRRSPVKSTSQQSVYQSPMKSLNSLKSVNRIAESKSHASFRRMVMSSSLHTLQLASFVNQIDQRAVTCGEQAVIELEIVKKYISHTFKNGEINAASEQEVRRQLCGCYFVLLSLQCHQLANGLLEIEWVRRTRIVERKGDVSDLWKAAKVETT